MKLFKTVLLPIEVPKGDFCWDGEVYCTYFHEDGNGHCKFRFNFSDLRDNIGNCLKAPECKLLKEKGE